MRKALLALGALATAGITVPAAAQRVDHRQYRQEQRIRHGERTGQLTPAEARRLQFLEMRLHRTEARMRSRSGGRLTWQERRRLQQLERRDNQAIYRLKHNHRRY